MKKALFITILFFLFRQIAFAQTNKDLSNLTVEEAFRPKMPTQIDTLYYPFYNGVQMIEIDHIGYWDKKIFFLEQSNPRAMPHSMFHPKPIGNEFFFRDTTGIIVKAFNSGQSLDELTKHFKKIPISKRHALSAFFPYHSSQGYRSSGIWYQSPQASFNFSGHYKVSTGFAEQKAMDFSQHLLIEKKQELKFGLIDSLGNVVIPIQYDEIFPLYENLLVQKDKKWGIISYRQTELVPLIYDSYRVDNYSRSVYPEKKGNVFFLTSKKYENHRTEYSYDALFLTAENKLIPLNNYDEIHFEGSWITNEDYSKRLLFVTKNGKRGLLNAQYKEIIPPQYEIFDYHKYEKGLFRVAQNGKFGFWDKNFKEIIPLEYDYAEYFRSDSTALVLKNGEFYCIDNKGKKQLNCKLKPIWKTRNLEFFINKNYVGVETHNVYGIVDTLSNSMILPIKYNSLSPVEISRFFDKNNDIFKQKKFEHNNSPDLYDEVLFHNNKIIVKNKENRYGVIDTTFRIVIDFKYEKLQVVQYNLKYLIYSRNGKPGVMDFSGKNILSSEYDEIRYNMHYEQERDIFQIKKKGKWGVVNFENKILVPCEYDSIRFLGHWNREKVKLWVVEKNNKFGVVDDKNEIFVPFEYDGISHLAGTTLWVDDKNKNRYKVELRK